MKIVLLVVDSLRADLPGFAGGPAQTPTLDALAAQGCSFATAVCSGSWTVPSVTAMMTGRWPQRAGVCNWRHDLPAGVPSLASTLSRAGWAVEAWVPYPRWWFAGWPGFAPIGPCQDLGAVEAALRAPGDRLLYIHYWNTHFPYLPSERPMPGYRQAMDLAMEGFRHAPARLAPRYRALYRRSVERWSEVVLPRWLAAAAAGGEDLLICVTADHGENHGEALPEGRRVEHVFDLHGRWLTDQTVQVPLVFWGRTAAGPVSPGRRGGVARGVDLAPTLCEAAGVPWSSDADGRSLLGAITADRPAPAAGGLTVASHNVYHPETYPEDGKKMWQRYCWTTPETRWIWDSASGEAWCTGAPDPRQTEAVWRQLRASWQGSIDALVSPDRPAPDPAREDRVQRRLRALGYLDGA